MKKLFFTCFLLQTVLLNAQECKVDLSNEFQYRDEGNIYKLGIFFYSDEQVSGPLQLAYTAKLKKVVHGVTLHKYDGNMQEIKKVELEEGKKTFGPLPSTMITFSNKLFLLYYKYTDDEVMKLNMSEINLEDLSLANTQELHSFNQKNVGMFKIERAMSNKLTYSFSPDGSKMLIASTGVPNEVFTCVVDKNAVVSKQQTSKIPFSPDKDFVGTSVFIDNQETKYLSFKYTEDKETERSILIQNSDGKESYQKFPQQQRDYKSNDIYFKNAKDNLKVYIYSTYSVDYLTEGILMATCDGKSLKVSSPKQYPYPDDFKQRIYKMDFGDRYKSNYSVRDVKYGLTELNNGTLVLTGYPSFTIEHMRADMKNWVSKSFTGPIVTAFIQNGKSTYTMIPRKQALTSGSDCIVIPNKNSIVCIYSDKEKNLKNDFSDKISTAESDELVLVSALINSDGSITSRTKIGEEPAGKNFYFISDNQEISPGHYLIPVGRSRVSILKYYTEIMQWATVSVQ